MPNSFTAKVDPFAVFNTDTVTISRSANSSGATWTTSTVYTGAGDLQEGGGSTFYNPNGVAEVSDAVLVINPASDGSLPSVNVGDSVTRTSDAKVFEVVSTSLRDSMLPHLELQLHVGPIKDDQQQ